MNWQETLTNLNSLMHQTPILYENLQDMGTEKIFEEMPDCFATIDALIKNVSTPLKVVVMGEVKAGKSTLINALVGAEISPTDVLETTAAIIEVGYAPKPYGIIQRDGQEIVSGNADRIFAILDFNRGNQDYFRGSVTVSIGLPLENLKEFYVVDTPGILSITAANYATAKNYIKEADVVLWVLNANHLGQNDITKEIADVASYGKPILGIINKIDQLDGDIDRVTDYVEAQLGIYLEKIFPLSAYKAWQGVKNQSNRQHLESGLEELLKYLREEIGLKAWQVKEESIQSASKALLEKFTNAHKKFLKVIDDYHNEVVIYEKELELRALEIERKIESYLRLQVYEVLFAEELQLLDERIQKLSASTTIDEKAKLTQEINSSFGTAVIQKWWEETETVISKMYSNEWWEAAKEIQDSKLRMLEEFDRIERFAVTGNLKKTELNTDAAAVDGLGQGIFVGTAFGLGLASYTAFIGPAATYISLGSAMLTFLPPLAIVGGLTGMFSKAWQADKDKREFVAELRAAVSQARDELWQNIIEGKVLSNLHKNSERTVNLLQEAYLSELIPNWDLAKLEKAENEISIYLTKLEQFKANYLQTLLKETATNCLF